MGVTFAKATVARDRAAGRKSLELEFLVDTGAAYSSVPSDLLRKLGVRPDETEEFTLADGTHVRYPVGEAFFVLGVRYGTSKVVFAPKGTRPLLGALTLEALALVVDPYAQTVRPMQLMLAHGLVRVRNSTRSPRGVGHGAMPR